MDNKTDASRIDVRRFIDDAAVEEAEDDLDEELDDGLNNEMNDPGQSKPLNLYNVTQLMCNPVQFLVDDDGDTVDEFHIVSDDRPPIRFNHEEAAEALQQAQAIVERYAPRREPSLLESEFTGHPMHQAAQLNMNMYCIDVPVSSILLLMREALTDPHPGKINR